MSADIQADVFAGTAHQRPRPTRHERSLRRAAAEELLPDVEDWIGEAITEGEREKLLKLLTEHVGEDGYEIARAFDHEGYMPNADLVGILDGFDTHRVHAKAVSIWLAETGVKAQLAVGTVVPLPSRLKEHVGVVGEIVGIDERRGEYTVCCESLGHVRDGLGVRGLIFTWEDVERAVHVAGETAHA